MENEVTQMLAELATQLGVTVTLLWSVLVRQALIVAWCSVVYLAILIFGWFSWFKWLLPLACKYGDDEEGKQCASVVSAIVSALGLTIASITFICRAPILFSGFYNPEYWALQKIVSLLN